MKRWWPVLALLLSVGINVGLLVSLALDRPQDPMPTDSPPRARDGSGRALENLADQLGLEGQDRLRFARLHRQFFEHLRRTVPQLQRMREQLYRELVSEHPDPERLQRLVADLARGNVAVEQSLIRTVLQSRELLDDEQERVYLHFLATRVRPLRHQLLGPRLRDGAPGAERSPDTRRPRERLER